MKRSIFTNMTSPSDIDVRAKRRLTEQAILPMPYGELKEFPSWVEESVHFSRSSLNKYSRIIIRSMTIEYTHRFPNYAAARATVQQLRDKLKALENVDKALYQEKFAAISNCIALSMQKQSMLLYFGLSEKENIASLIEDVIKLICYQGALRDFHYCVNQATPMLKTVLADRIRFDNHQNDVSASVNQAPTVTTTSMAQQLLNFSGGLFVEKEKQTAASVLISEPLPLKPDANTLPLPVVNDLPIGGLTSFLTVDELAKMEELTEEEFAFFNEPIRCFNPRG